MSTQVMSVDALVTAAERAVGVILAKRVGVSNDVYVGMQLAFDAVRAAAAEFALMAEDDSPPIPITDEMRELFPGVFGLPPAST